MTPKELYERTKRVGAENKVITISSNDGDTERFYTDDCIKNGHVVICFNPEDEEF